MVGERRDRTAEFEKLKPCRFCAHGAGRPQGARRRNCPHGRARRGELKCGRQVIILPEGTPTAPGAPPSHKSGLVHVYAAAGVPCLPVALNSGLFWPRRKFLRRPATIVLEVLDPIPPGLDNEEFAARLEREIETATGGLEGAKD